MEAPPDDLTGIADLVCVNFPWRALLRGLLRPDATVLSGLRRLGAAAAEYRFVLCYDPVHDAAAFEGETPPRLDRDLIEGRLAPAYAKAGIALGEWRLLSRAEALAIPSSWGRRLLHGRPRDVYLVAAAGPEGI